MMMKKRIRRGELLTRKMQIQFGVLLVEKK